jgi:spermidine synthase
MATQTLLAQIPLLVAPKPEEVFVIGWGTGVTVGSALQAPVRRVTAVELEPAVVESSQFFVHVNHEPLRDARLRLYADDARHILLASDDTYDVIISEPPHPWVSGVANLFTRDFYRLAARRLAPDGVFAQWVQSYQISLENYRSVLASFQSVFPEVMIFRSPVSADTILIGSRRPIAIDVDELERRASVDGVRADLARIGFTAPASVLAAFHTGPREVKQLITDAPLNTDDNMRVEFSALEAMLTDDLPAVRGIQRHEAPVESVLADPADLLGNRARLDALLEGLKTMQRPTARYEQARKTAR